MTKRKPCYRGDGRLKVRRDRTDAEATALDQSERKGAPFNAYQCPSCHYWHVGRPPQQSHLHHFDWASAICAEIGPRAYHCMVTESIGDVERRVTVILARSHRFHLTRPG